MCRARTTSSPARRMAATGFNPEWDAEADRPPYRPPYRWRRRRIGRQAGGGRPGALLFEVPPGASTFPLHAHHANEELIVVVAGRLVLRTLDGERGPPVGAHLRPGHRAARRRRRARGRAGRRGSAVA